MRIISQNGTIDMPYDMCCVWRQEEVFTAVLLEVMIMS